MAGQTLIFFVYLLDLSSWHGNGSAVWISSDGAAVVQLANDEVCKKKDCIFKFAVSREALDRISTLIAKPEWQKAESFDPPLNRTDPVRDYLGFEGPKGSGHFALWEHNWDKQPALLQELREALLGIAKEARRQKPAETRPLKPGSLQPAWPENFPRPPSGPLSKKGS